MEVDLTKNFGIGKELNFRSASSCLPGDVHWRNLNISIGRVDLLNEPVLKNTALEVQVMFDAIAANGKL